MKKYFFELIIKEGNDEFWESLTGTGCDEVHQMVKDQLEFGGALCCDGEYQNCILKLIRYGNEASALGN